MKTDSNRKRYFGLVLLGVVLSTLLVITLLTFQVTEHSLDIEKNFPYLSDGKVEINLEKARSESYPHFGRMLLEVDYLMKSLERGNERLETERILWLCPRGLKVMKKDNVLSRCVIFTPGQEVLLNKK
jgi:hypothetical protein